VADLRRGHFSRSKKWRQHADSKRLSVAVGTKDRNKAFEYHSNSMSIVFILDLIMWGVLGALVKNTEDTR